MIFAQKLGAADGDNSEILIPHIPTISKDTGGTFKSFKRTEFPVLVTYYLTLNRAQGQTLQRSEMYLPRSVFHIDICTWDTRETVTHSKASCLQGRRSLKTWSIYWTQARHIQGMLFTVRLLVLK